MAMCLLAHVKCAYRNADEGSQLYRNALQVLTDSKSMPLDDNVMEKMIAAFSGKGLGALNCLRFWICIISNWLATFLKKSAIASFFFSYGIMTAELQEMLYREQQIGVSGLAVNVDPKGNNLTAVPKLK
ncbi:unnamed protein product [Camellia sinensis]